MGGHFGCFHILATGDNAAVNTEGHVGFELVFSFPSEKYPGGTARSYGNSTFGFLRQIYVSVYSVCKKSVLDAKAKPATVPTLMELRF